MLRGAGVGVGASAKIDVRSFADVVAVRSDAREYGVGDGGHGESAAANERPRTHISAPTDCHSPESWRCAWRCALLKSTQMNVGAAHLNDSKTALPLSRTRKKPALLSRAVIGHRSTEPKVTGSSPVRRSCDNIQCRDQPEISFLG